MAHGNRTRAKRNAARRAAAADRQRVLPDHVQQDRARDRAAEHQKAYPAAPHCRQDPPAYAGDKTCRSGSDRTKAARIFTQRAKAPAVV